MFWLSGGFVFKRVPSLFSRLDPRVRLLLSIGLFVLALLSNEVIEVVSILLTILVLASIAKCLRRISRTMAFSAVFGFVIFILNFFVFKLGLDEAVLYALRFLAIISSTSVFFVTTSPDELEQIMRWLRFPRDVVFAFVTAIRFIPVVMLDAFQIMDAQKSRGLEFEKGNIFKRVRNFVPILIPLVVNSVIRSGELAEAMDSRAYGATPRPTSLYRMSLSWQDIVVLLAGLLLFVLATLYIYHVPLKV